MRLEIQIGGADTRDNVAFMPVMLRDEDDTTDASAIQVNMGLVRENGEWKILSPSASFFFSFAFFGIGMDLWKLNEVAAFESLKDIAEAVETFRRKYTRLPATLSSLGPPLHGPASADTAQLLDPYLWWVMKNGYSFRYVIVGASGLGAPAKYELAATPLSYGRTGRLFFRDAGGTLRAADRQGAVGSASDPRLPEH